MTTISRPKLSIITPSLNTGKFLQATLDSILGQSFTDYEFIVVDGGSTDGTLEILAKYPQITVITEKGSGYWAALDKALDLVRGDYVMNCAISDGYLDSDWFKKCVEALDRDKEVSLVWGLPRSMAENGELLQVSFPQFQAQPAPQKEAFFSYWLASGFWFPEGNLCARREVFRKCLLPFSPELVHSREFWVTFAYEFNTRGYLAFFLPVVANYGRVHKGQAGQHDLSGEQRKFVRYLGDVHRFRRRLMLGRVRHVYRDGEGNLLPCAFSRGHFIIHELLSPSRGPAHLKNALRNRGRIIFWYLRSKGIISDAMHDAMMARRREKAMAQKK